MLSKVYITVRCPSVRLSVCPVDPQQQRCAAGLLLSALQTGAVDRWLRRRRPAANARTASCSEPTEAHRLVICTSGRMFCYLLVHLPREGRGLISPVCAGPSYPAAPAGTCPGPPSLRRPPNCAFVIFPSRELSATNCAVFAG